MHTQHPSTRRGWLWVLGIVGTLVTLGIVAVSGRQVWAVDDEASRTTLKGLSRIAVGVGVGTVAPELERSGITTQQVQTEVEQQLRRAGLQVFSSQGAGAPPDIAVLSVAVTTFSHPEGLYAYAVDLVVYQNAALLRDPTPRSLVTWTIGSIGLVDTSSLRAIFTAVHQNVDQFIQAYRAVNPRARTGAATAASRRMRQVQEHLRAAGFAPGPLDGQLGPQTQEALRHYQRAKGWRATGTLDTRTLRALGLQ